LGVVFFICALMSDADLDKLVLEEDKEVCSINEEDLRNLIEDTLNTMIRFEQDEINRIIYENILFDISDKTDMGYMVTFSTPDIYQMSQCIDENFSEQDIDEYIIKNLRQNNYPRYDETIEVIVKTSNGENMEIYLSNDLQNIMTGNLLKYYG